MAQETLDAARDGPRLAAQRARVFDLMQDSVWRKLGDIASITGYPEASVSARLRDFRKTRYGKHVVNRRYVHNGLWEYQLLPNGNDAHDREGA